MIWLLNDQRSQGSNNWACSDMTAETLLHQVLKNTDYTHCLASGKNILMIGISKAHFLFL